MSQQLISVHVCQKLVYSFMAFVLFLLIDFQSLAVVQLNQIYMLILKKCTRIIMDEVFVSLHTHPSLYCPMYRWYHWFRSSKEIIALDIFKGKGRTESNIGPVYLFLTSSSAKCLYVCSHPCLFPFLAALFLKTIPGCRFSNISLFHSSSSFIILISMKIRKDKRPEALVWK